MKHTIEKMKSLSPDGEIGYAFIDEYNRCIIVVYGERRRDSLVQYLNSDKDPLRLKYYYFDLNRT